MTKKSKNTKKRKTRQRKEKFGDLEAPLGRIWDAFVGLRDQIKLEGPRRAENRLFARGLANRAVIDCFSHVLDLQKASISIVAGHTSRKKTVRFENISEGDLLTLLKQETGEAPEAGALRPAQQKNGWDAPGISGDNAGV